VFRSSALAVAALCWLVAPPAIHAQRESETNGLGSLGRLVFRTALQVSDYMQSVSAETKSRKVLGIDLLK
jgi:hypothetical protein